MGLQRAREATKIIIEIIVLEQMRMYSVFLYFLSAVILKSAAQMLPLTGASVIP